MNDTRIDLKHAPVYKYLLDRFLQTEGLTLESIHHSFTYSPLPYISEREYIGYYQCEKYFKHRREEIINLFRPAEKFIPSINKYSHLFGHISLHVRRGDYVHTQHTHPLQTIEYYTTAISLLPKELQILVFSDDVLWCRENFIGERYVFIEEMDYISIYLMAKMNHHIIANSSFSWWGAWMSDWKKVIAPKKWFNCCLSDKDIVPETWIKV
jgi:hypothetical protein